LCFLVNGSAEDENGDGAAKSAKLHLMRVEMYGRIGTENNGKTNDETTNKDV